MSDKLSYAYYSYFMACFYYEQGIPDDKWYTSPGDDGCSVQYLPCFEEKHFLLKHQFDFYADAFLFNTFSAFDTLGQYLNVRYGLRLTENKVHFVTAVRELMSSTVDASLGAQLTAIVDGLKDARDLRNAIAHKLLPSSVGTGITESRDSSTLTIGLGVGEYVTSRRTMELITKTLQLMGQAIECIQNVGWE